MFQGRGEARITKVVDLEVNYCNQTSYARTKLQRTFFILQYSLSKTSIRVLPPFLFLSRNSAYICCFL